MSGEGESYAVVDATGQEVKIPGKPKRILGNSASIDTMLLGVVTADHLVGATEADRDPAISYIAEWWLRHTRRARSSRCIAIWASLSW